MIKKLIFNRWTMGTAWMAGLILAGAETDAGFWWINIAGVVIFGGVALAANRLRDKY